MNYTLAIRNDSTRIQMFDTTDEKAITAFIREHQRFVFNIAFRYLNSFEDAQDASQDAFIKAINGMSKFRGDSSVKTWLYNITKNTCLTYIKKKKIKKALSFYNSNENKEYEMEVIDNSYRPDNKFENKELEAKFLKAINDLPEKQRETFALRYYEDMPYNEISKLLGTSVGGLKANYFQAIKKISEELKEYKPN